MHDQQYCYAALLLLHVHESFKRSARPASVIECSFNQLCIQFPQIWKLLGCAEQRACPTFVLKLCCQQAASVQRALLFFNGFFITRDGKKLYTYTNTAASFLPRCFIYTLVRSPARKKEKDFACCSHVLYQQQSIVLASSNVGPYKSVVVPSISMMMGTR